jgi:hypothetical protein
VDLDLVANQVPSGLPDEDLALACLVVELGADVGRVAKHYVLAAEQRGE